MGYFSNGTEGQMYEEQYCHNCVHYGPDEAPDCSVWTLHLIYNYGNSDDIQACLNALIPRTKDGLGNEQCAMFHRKE